MDIFKKTIIAAEAQKKYCNKKELPYFAPHNGKCYRCHKNIYEKISVEYASNYLITGCPHCKYSFCE